MLFRNLRERFVTHLIGDYVPVLNLVRHPAKWPTLEELREYPKGSLGAETKPIAEATLPFRLNETLEDVRTKLAA